MRSFLTAIALIWPQSSMASQLQLVATQHVVFDLSSFDEYVFSKRTPPTDAPTEHTVFEGISEPCFKTVDESFLQDVLSFRDYQVEVDLDKIRHVSLKIYRGEKFEVAVTGTGLIVDNHDTAWRPSERNSEALLRKYLEVFESICAM